MSGRRAIVFFSLTGLLGGHGLLGPTQDQGVLVLNHPLDGLPLLELHGLGQRGGEVDVPLLALLPLDELNLGRVTHGDLLSDI